MFSTGAMVSQERLPNPLRLTSSRLSGPELNDHVELPELRTQNRASISRQQSAAVGTPLASKPEFANSFPISHDTNREPSIPAAKLQNKSRTEQRMGTQDSEMEDWGNGKDGVSQGFTHFSSLENTVQTRSKNLVAMPLRQLVYPKSRYQGHHLPFPVCKERIAVAELREDISRAASPPSSIEFFADEHDFEEVLLSDFSIYNPPASTYRPFELQGLQNLTLHGNSTFMFDGVLSVGENKRYVERVAFEICSIGHYGQENHEVGSSIWIQSILNTKEDVHYKLGTPSTEYARYHYGFLWLANLAKHFVDYCHASENDVSIQNFRSDFSRWIQTTHKDSASFQAWYSSYKSEDFRMAVSRNIEFLFKESIGVDEKLRSQPIWGELLIQDSQFLNLYPMKETKTIVTPYVYRCFSHLKFGSHLKAVESVREVKTQQNIVSNALNLTDSAPIKAKIEASDSEPERSENWQPHLKGMPHSTSPDLEQKIKSIQGGDVIAVPLDDVSSWKDEVSPWKAADTCWYLLVQDINTERDGEKSFNGIWLYAPSQTLCAKMKYPHPNELFLSDHCNCGHPAKITADKILDVVSINWHGQPSVETRGLFIRQTYLENERFVDLQQSHKTCIHFKAGQTILAHSMTTYHVGQTVLARPLTGQRSKFDLEIYEIIDRFEEDGGRNKQYRVVLRHLRRRSEFDSIGKPNELVYTDLQDEVSEGRIYSNCAVRFFDENIPIPAPYNRGGAGNMFFITQKRTTEEDGSANLVPLTTYPKTLIQGFDPHVPHEQQPLRGLDLYCGGGNFGRGLEEGGAVENSVAVDLDKAAIHTYNANLRPGSKTQMFFGSVDDLLNAAIRGNPRKLKAVPLPGDIDFISAGSPCQGFSLLNSNKNNEKSMKNQSLVASVAAYIDVYRPRYGLLENVISMAQKGNGRDQDVLSQLICAVVGMGYQTQIMLLDAWSSGSPQSRSRLFLCFAAPGMQPLDIPAFSHSHPPGTIQRSLGTLANGKPFGSRNLNILTPFKFISLSESAKDLPVIGDGMTGHCTAYPDHILKETATESIRRQIQAIPLFPRGSSFAKVWCDEATRTMSKEERLFFPADKTNKGKTRDCVQAASKGWQRARPDRLISTITVSPQYHNSRGGSTIHWNEHRSISLMEYRRGQTYPDDEILVGSRAKGIKIIGNSVARSVAVSLGVRLREAWLRTKPDDIATIADAKSNLLRTKAQLYLPIIPTSRSASTSSKTKPIEIPDSTETTDDEECENHSSGPRQNANAFPAASMLPTSNLRTRGSMGEQPKSMKRPRSMSQDIQTPQGRASKSPRLSEKSTMSNVPSSLRNTHPSSTQSASAPRVVSHSASMPQPKKLVSKSPAKSSSAVIDLTSDTEDDVLVVKEFRASKAPATPYKAVNNSFLNAYAQTNQFMNYGAQRKYGPIQR